MLIYVLIFCSSAHNMITSNVPSSSGSTQITATSHDQFSSTYLRSLYITCSMCQWHMFVNNNNSTVYSSILLQLFYCNITSFTIAFMFIHAHVLYVVTSYLITLTFNCSWQSHLPLAKILKSYYRNVKLKAIVYLCFHFLFFSA